MPRSPIPREPDYSGRDESRLLVETAQKILDEHGTDALKHVQMQEDLARAKGHTDDADTWLDIEAALRGVLRFRH